MSTREKTLAAVVGALLVTLLSYLLLTSFQKKLNTLQGQIRQKKVEIDTMKTLIAERDLWLQRDQWLKAQQSPLHVDPSTASKDLMEEAKGIAQKHSIILESPSFGVQEFKPSYQSVSVSFEAKAKWDTLVDFLYEMQSPTAFIVFDKCSMSLDQTDKTQVRGKFQISRWYAPKSS